MGRYINFVAIRSVGFLNPTASNMSIYNAKQDIWLGWMCCVTLPHCKCSYSERSDLNPTEQDFCLRFLNRTNDPYTRKAILSGITLQRKCYQVA